MRKSPALTSQLFPYELRIGVTGHRDLTHPTAVEQAVRNLLHHLVSVLAEASARPIALTAITSLARGADQIVARVVCDIAQRQGRGPCLEAVLPFAIEDYEREFAAPDLAQFRKFLELDHRRDSPRHAPVIVGHDSDGREAAFEKAGQTVVDSSEILVAIWDPAHEERRGGTAGAVRYAINAGRMVLWLNPANLDAGFAVLRSLDEAQLGSRDPQRPDVPRGCRIEPVPSRAEAWRLPGQ